MEIFTNSTGNAQILGTCGFNGYVTFKGSSNTTITGSTNFSNLIVQKTSSTYQVSISSGTVSICNSLEATTGDFNANGNPLILEASLTGGYTAYINGNGNGNVDGSTVTVEEQVFETYITYHALCNPVQSASPASMSAFSNSVNLDGGYDYPNLGPSGQMPTFYWYYEPAVGYSADAQYYGWEGVGTSGEGNPYYDMQGYYGLFLANSNLISWTGTVNNGDINAQTLSYTNNSQPTWDGWNFIGNPYPSPFDWNAWYTDNGSSYPYLASAAWTWENNMTEYYGSYVFWDPNDQGNSTMPNGVFAIGQGIMVQTSNGGENLTFHNSERATGTPYFYAPAPKTSPNSLALKLSGANNKDITFIRIGDEFTDGFDFSMDVTKFMNPQNSIYTVIPEGNLAANKLPFPTTEKVVPLHVDVADAGVYDITANSFTFDTTQFSAYFKDKQENQYLLITSAFDYSFSASGASGDRFEVHLMNKLASPSTGITNLTAANGMHSFYQNDILNIQLFDQSTPATNISLVDLSGQTVYNGKLDLMQGKAQLSVSTLAPGMYLVTAKTATGVYTDKVNIIR